MHFQPCQLEHCSCRVPFRTSTIQLSRRHDRQRTDRAALDSLRRRNHLGGLLYFFNLVGVPTMKQLEPAVRAKMFPVLMTRAMWWFRWSALVTVLVGLRYFSEILAVDAQNAGNPALAWRWLGWWLLVWLVAYALIYPLQLPSKGVLNNPWVRAIAISVDGDCRFVGRSGPERKSASVERAPGHQRRRRARPADAAERLGSGVARAEAADRLDARERRAGNADAAGSRAAGALGIPRVAGGILALVSHAVLHGRGRTLSVSWRHYKLIGGN